jgi:hypothetical protein
MLGKILKFGSGLLDFGMGFSDRKHARSMSRTAFNESKRQFDQQMNESITRRVADAKNAGVHPLFALGASSGASPTTSFGGGSSAAPRISGMRELMSSLLETENDVKRSTKKVNEADAALKNAQAAVLTGHASSTGRDIDPYGDTRATYYAPEIPTPRS